MAEPTLPTVEAFGRYLALIALFGAARKDATPGQVEALKGVAARLKEPSEDEPLAGVVRSVFDVMGPHWNPLETEEFGPWLLQLLRERREAPSG